jgi:hypothetical protein
MKKLRDIQQTCGKSLAQMVSYITENLHDEPYSRNEIAAILELTEDELIEKFLTARSKTGSYSVIFSSVYL